MAFSSTRYTFTHYKLLNVFLFLISIKNVFKNLYMYLLHIKGFNKISNNNKNMNTISNSL